MIILEGTLYIKTKTTMISISGFVFLNDMDSGRKYGTRISHTTLEIKDIDGDYIIFLKLSPDHLESTYLLRDLDSVTSYEKKVVLKFEKPNHELLVMSDDANEIMCFLYDISKNLKMNTGKSFLVNALKPFGHITDDHNKLKNFDVTHLRMLALENCYLPHLPEAIGNLTFSSISLNGSRINMSKYGQDLFWNWMTKHDISTSLVVFEINSIGLTELPFEIIHFKRLRTLSVSNNKLKPHFIGKLPRLKNLMVNGNSLRYFPDNLYDTVYKTLNTSNNQFVYLKCNEGRHIELIGLRGAPKLSHLSVLSLINNCLKFKRQEIPRPLWNSYYYFSHCKICKKVLVLNEKKSKIFDCLCYELRKY